MNVPAKINIHEAHIAGLADDWRRQLAVYQNPSDLVHLADQVEFIRAAATKANLSRESINRIAAVLWDTVRKGGKISAQFERRTGGDSSGHDARSKLPAKELGYRDRQQRQRWEICAALPDVVVEDLKEKILAKADGVLTLASLISAGKHHLRIEDAEAQRVLEDSCTTDDLQILIDRGKKFGVIYSDPPWSFKVYSGRGKSRSADRFYKPDEKTGDSTMTIEQLKELPVPKLAADDSALFLWSIWPQLSGALEVIEAWGFTYKTCGLLWVKQNESGNGLHWGMGYWTRANSEPCLFATKGSPQRLAKDVHQIIQSPIGEHSRKPEEASVRIERLLAGPYLEMFGRRPMVGWTVWGNQINKEKFRTSENTADLHPDTLAAVSEPALKTSPPGAGSSSLDNPEFLRRTCAGWKIVPKE
jgi:N6-adenosine-specific RNA methylase IME4